MLEVNCEFEKSGMTKTKLRKSFKFCNCFESAHCLDLGRNLQKNLNWIHLNSTGLFYLVDVPSCTHLICLIFFK